MNQEKIGKFIADMRKKKKMTQEELANKIHVSNKAVSKWETGKGVPDYSSLSGLCKALDVTVVELLNGEETVKDNVDDTMVNSIKFYENSTKRKYLKIFGFISLILVCCILFVLSMYWMNNYNQIKVYNISTTDVLELDGTIIFNPKQKCLVINRIYYNDIYTGTDLELKVKGLDIKIINDDGKIYIKTGNLSSARTNEVKKINEYLYDISILDMEQIENDSGYIKEKDISNLKMILEYIDENNEFKTFEYSIESVKEFANTDLFY